MRCLAFRIGFVCMGLLLTLSAAGASGAISARGRLVFATGGDGVSDRLEIAAIRPDGHGLTRITRHAPSGYAPRWTRDGRAIVFESADTFTREGGYWRMRANGTRALRLPGDPSDYWPPSPSGRFAAVAERRGIAIVNAAGRTVRMLRFRLGEAEFYDGVLAWSRDERRIAVNVADEEADTVRVFVMRVDGEAPARALTPKVEGRYEYALSWSPDGRALAVDTSGSTDFTTIQRVRADGSGRRLLAFDAAASGEHDWAPDGSRLAYVGRGGGVYVAATATGHARRLVQTRFAGTREARDIGLAWSPAGGEVAYSDEDGIHVARVAGGSRRITRHGARSDPAWSPDGRRIAFSQGREIFLVHRDGRGLRPITHAVQDDSPKPSRDGSRIAFVRGASGFTDPAAIYVYVVDRNGKRPRRIGRGYDPQWSPDGRRLAFVDVAPSRDPPEAMKHRAGRIMVWDAAARTLRQVAVGTAPTWSPDGSRLAYMQYTFDLRVTWRGASVAVISSSLWVAGIDGSAPRKLLDPPEEAEGRGALYYDPAWAPRSDKVALVESSSVWDADEGEWRPRVAIAVLDVGTGEIQRINGSGEPAWSPDGTRLLVGNLYSVDVADVATGVVRTVLPNRGSLIYRYPVWSPDGVRIGFVAEQEEKGSDVYVVAADGTGIRRLTRTAGVEGALAWSSH